MPFFDVTRGQGVDLQGHGRQHRRMALNLGRFDDKLCVKVVFATDLMTNCAKIALRVKSFVSPKATLQEQLPFLANQIFAEFDSKFR